MSGEMTGDNIPQIFVLLIACNLCGLGSIVYSRSRKHQYVQRRIYLSNLSIELLQSLINSVDPAGGIEFAKNML
jgi:hypothetical protein